MRRMIPSSVMTTHDGDAVFGKNVEVDGTLQVNTDILQGSNFLVKGMLAPKSTTLTDDDIAQIVDGRFINGNFLGLKNPVFLPAQLVGTAYYGIVMGYKESGENDIALYVIETTNKLISIGAANQKYIYLKNIGSVNGKAIPNYPSGAGTFTLKSVNGTLTWVSEQ